MREVTYKDGAKDLTLEQAIKAYDHGIITMINDGRDITICLEKRDK